MENPFQFNGIEAIMRFAESLFLDFLWLSISFPNIVVSSWFL